ncbi:nucleic acid dioxygenase ALKBH1-like isoform X2 [Portunus trituberculatus]|uniref:nucleic acid dioxygenase ALKBH1-like isoform X2 n=1 Tax=Portunus trituberculatus TaxID=210409 RepID=UPI001E1CC784|nr:nucleic acid dioxygenase ALKBH1-like isoform X2 [Portunus trituberculatus]
MNKEKGKEDKIMDMEKDEQEKEKEWRQMNKREKEKKEKEDKDGRRDKQIKTGRQDQEEMKKKEEKKDRQTKIMKENEKETKNKDDNRKTHCQGEKTRKQGKEEEEEKKKEEQEQEEEEEEDRFKDIFKYYKRRKPPPDLTQAIDVDSCCVEVQSLPLASEQHKAMAQEAGLTPPDTWTVHHLINHPGLVVVRNPFTRAGQLAWACQCLRDMARPPHKTNLASHGIHLEASTWWQLCRTEEGRRSGLREKLRWVTLGYHHDWDTKEYSEDNRSDMPDSVVRLCGVVAQVLGFCGSGRGGGGEFKAQAGIINYYHHHSTLSPHTDHSEPYMEAPLLSFSFGQSAVFLIGGCTKATAPSAILLHSGDIVVMAGAARLCYHAVPRILLQAERRKEEDKEEPWAVEFGEFKTWRKRRKVEEKQDEEIKTQETMQKPEKSKQHKDTDDSAGDDSDLPDILHYLRTCRINMNIRQVLPPSMNALPS